MIKRMVQLPRIAAIYMRQIGMEIHVWTWSSPGIPIRRKTSELLKTDMGGSVSSLAKSETT
jgi:hypothetical protein